jgi:hypothetical protein
MSSSSSSSSTGREAYAVSEPQPDLLPSSSSIGADTAARSKNTCLVPECTNTIASQGHCVKHGAPQRKCSVEWCIKNSQGGRFHFMCKRHFKDVYVLKIQPSQQGVKNPDEVVSSNQSSLEKPPLSCGEVLQQSFGWRYAEGKEHPLIQYLKRYDENGWEKTRGWHIAEERRVVNQAQNETENIDQHRLNPGEFNLMMMEYALISGIPKKTQGKTLMMDFAWAWGRHDKSISNASKVYIENRADPCRTRKADDDRKRKAIITPNDQCKSARHEESPQGLQPTMSWDLADQSPREVWKTPEKESGGTYNVMSVEYVSQAEWEATVNEGILSIDDTLPVDEI